MNVEGTHTQGPEIKVNQCKISGTFVEFGTGSKTARLCREDLDPEDQQKYDDFAALVDTLAG